MLFKATLPVMVTANPPRRPAPTKCVFRLDTEIELADVTPQDAPIVMTVHGNYLEEVKNWWGPVPIRMVGNQHLLPLMSVNAFAAALRDPFLSLSHGTMPYFQSISDVHTPIRSRLYDALDNNGGLIARPWPSTIEHLVRPGSSPDTFEAAAKAFERSVGKITLDDNAIAESESHRDFFANGFQGYAVIDGFVFRPIPEPCFHVNVDSGFISSVIPFGLFPSPYNPSTAQLFTSANHFFAADQLDEAKEYSRSQGKEKFALEIFETTKCAIDVHVQSALLGHDYAAAGLHRTAREIRDQLNIGPKSVDMTVAQVVMELGQAIEAGDAFNVSPTLENAVRAAVALEDFVPDWYHRRIDVDTADRIKLQLDRQDSVPIEFSIRHPKL
jgi:hypothetical protein